MKKIIVTITLFSQILWAHGDHKTLGLNEAIERAKGYVSQLTTDKKLTESWTDAKVAPTETREETVAGRKRWLVTFTNPSEKDQSKAKLEMVMTPGGKLVDHKITELKETK